jgi:hypothetical protein
MSIAARPLVGTLAWARRNRGRLRWYDRLTLTAHAVLFQLKQRFHTQNKSPFSLDVQSLRVPDSALCVTAGQLLASVSEPWLVNHCLRTFLWATILGKKDHRTYDEELLFVASALHDLGLTEAGAKLSPAPAECFAVEGAFAAEAFMAQRGVDHQRRELIAEAISLHLNVRVPLKQGVEAHLLQAGAALDVVGARYDELAATTRDGVVNLHPRLELKNSLAALMKQQSRARPLSRAGFLCSHGFISLIRQSAFAFLTLLCGCAPATQSSTAAEQTGPDCSFRSPTTCWTLSGQFPPVRAKPQAAPLDSVSSQTTPVLASEADSTRSVR